MDKIKRKWNKAKLKNAIRDHQWETVCDLVEQNRQLFDTLLNKRGPGLLLIICGAPTAIVNKLMDPANINLVDEKGNTALHQAVKEDQWKLVPILLEHGADINLCNHMKEAPLHLAVFRNAPDNIITSLVSQRNINLQGMHGNTMLHSVVMGNKWQLVLLLLQHGADIDIANVDNRAPLYEAVSGDGAPADTIAQLISRQSINLQSTFDRSTALHEAVKQERWDLVVVLIEHAADVNLCDCDNKTPLFWAVGCNASGDIITSLISPLNINEIDRHGNTVLHETVSREWWEIVPILLKHGADVNKCDAENLTPLRWAARQEAPTDVLAQLISPENAGMQDANGDTVLHEAVRCNRWDQVPVLKQETNIKQANEEDETPLHVAMSQDVPKDVLVHLISPLTVNRKNKDGDTPLKKAVSEDRWELVEVLLKHGADASLLGSFSQHGQPFVHSLKVQCIGTIQKQVSSKYEPDPDVEETL